jgi:hypothetical protein
MSGTMQCNPETRRFKMTTGSDFASVRSSVSDSRELAMIRPSRSGSERRSISRSRASDSCASFKVTTKPALGGCGLTATDDAEVERVGDVGDGQPEHLRGGPWPPLG